MGVEGKTDPKVSLMEISTPLILVQLVLQVKSFQEITSELAPVARVFCIEALILN